MLIVPVSYDVFQTLCEDTSTYLIHAKCCNVFELFTRAKMLLTLEP